MTFRAACRVMLVLWVAWFVYMLVWFADAVAGAASDGFVVLLIDCGCEPVIAVCFYVLLAFTGVELWMFAASCVLRLVCRLAAKLSGTEVPAFDMKCRPVRFALVGFHGLMFAIAVYNAFLMMLGVGGMLTDPHDGVVVMGLFAVPIMLGMCLVVCGFCATMCVVSYFMTGLDIRWVGSAWKAAFGNVSIDWT